MDELTSLEPSEPPDPEGMIARRTLLGVLGAAFGGALGVALLGITRNLPAAAATVVAPVATAQPTVDHSLHAAASPTPSASPTDHDARHRATTAAFAAKTQIESVINDPTDVGCQRRLKNLGEFQKRARAANRRLLEVERVGQRCVVSTALLERVSLPTVESGQRVAALRFGDPRVMALAASLCVVVHAALGFTNQSLCAWVSRPLGGYTTAQATYDLRRLRLKGLIQRLPHSNTYVLTAEGVRWALFYTKLQDRLLGPLLAADQPPASVELRRALRVIDTSVDQYIDAARMRPAA